MWNSKLWDYEKNYVTEESIQTLTIQRKDKVRNSSSGLKTPVCFHDSSHFCWWPLTMVKIFYPKKTEEWRNPVRHNARQVGRELECVTRRELGYVVMKGQGTPLAVFPTLWQTDRVHPFTKHREQSSSNTEGVQASREPFLLPINESLSKCAASSLALSLPPPTLSLSLW